MLRAHDASWARVRRTVMALLIVTTAAFVALAPAAGAAPQSPPPAAWIVVDAGTGEVLLAGNEHTPLRPASTTKVMTAITALERLDPAEPIVISEAAAAQPENNIGAEVGERWPLETALAAILLESANDLSYALAEEIGDGDLAEWERIVNETGTRLGMTDSTFNDPAGLDAEGEAYSTGPLASVHDVAVATRNALAVPALAALGSRPTFEFEWPGTDTVATMENHNPMLAGGDSEYLGTTGFKTGFTEAAGRTMVATAERGGRELIAVAFDTYDIYAWSAQLLDEGFAIPPGSGTGVTLPDVAIQPYGVRQADLLSFTALALGDEAPADLDALSDTASGPGTFAPEEPGTGIAAAGDSAAETSEAGVAEDAGTSGEASGDTEPAEDDAAVAQDASGDSSDAGFPTTVVVLALFSVLAAAFFIRRRQIQVRKRRRAARRRVTARAIRRGTLPVANTLAPVASRASSPRGAVPVDSHVKVIPIDSRAEPSPAHRRAPTKGRGNGSSTRRPAPRRPARPTRTR